MTTDDVIEIIELFSRNHIDVIIDGGWGVDALLGIQTRKHEDLDIAMQHRDVEKIRGLLEAKGYRDVPRDDTRECNFVLGDAKGHLIDIHTYEYDSAGKIIFGVEYPYDSLKGVGRIKDCAVKCITADWMVKFHSGYELDENDYQDVKLLCERYGIEIPEGFEKFVMKDTQPLSGEKRE